MSRLSTLVLTRIRDFGPFPALDVARWTGASLPVVYRVLADLHDAGYLDHDADGSWSYVEPAIQPVVTPDPLPELAELLAQALSTASHAEALAGYRRWQSALQLARLTRSQRDALRADRARLATHLGRLQIDEHFAKRTAA